MNTSKQNSQARSRGRGRTCEAWDPSTSNLRSRIFLATHHISPLTGVGEKRHTPQQRRGREARRLGLEGKKFEGGGKEGMRKNAKVAKKDLHLLYVFAVARSFRTRFLLTDVDS